jgi:hypothetical protein
MCSKSICECEHCVCFDRICSAAGTSQISIMDKKLITATTFTLFKLKSKCECNKCLFNEDWEVITVDFDKYFKKRRKAIEAEIRKNIGNRFDE